MIDRPFASSHKLGASVQAITGHASHAIHPQSLATPNRRGHWPSAAQAPRESKALHLYVCLHASHRATRRRGDSSCSYRYLQNTSEPTPPWPLIEKQGHLLKIDRGAPHSKSSSSRIRESPPRRDALQARTVSTVNATKAAAPAAATAARAACACSGTGTGPTLSERPR